MIWMSGRVALLARARDDVRDRAGRRIRPLSEELPLQHRERGAVVAQVFREACFFLQPIDVQQVRVLDEVLADTRQRMLDLHADGFEQRGIADAGELQDLRRKIGAAADDDFAPRADVIHVAVTHDLDAGRAPQLERHARDLRAGAHGEVLASSRGPQIGARRAGAIAAGHGELDAADALVGAGVLILDPGHAQVARGMHQRGQQRIRLVHRDVRDGPVGAVPVVRAAPARLELLEERQHARVVPAVEAARGPRSRSRWDGRAC